MICELHVSASNRTFTIYIVYINIYRKKHTHTYTAIRTCTVLFETNKKCIVVCLIGNIFDKLINEACMCFLGLKYIMYNNRTNTRHYSIHDQINYLCEEKYIFG